MAACFRRRKGGTRQAGHQSALWCLAEALESNMTFQEVWKSTTAVKWTGIRRGCLGFRLRAQT